MSKLYEPTKVGDGARLDSGKTRYELLPTHLLKSTADVLAYGASKYAAWYTLCNWCWLSRSVQQELLRALQSNLRLTH